MKAYLIARVSSEDQLEALPAQVYRLEDYAHRKKFKARLEQFQESAFKGDRLKFKKIVEEIESETETVAVVFDKIDRLTRDFSDGEVQKIQKLCQQGKVEIHFVSDNLVLHQNSVAIQHAQFGMGMVMAQYYSNSTSDNVKRRIDQKLRDGEWPGKAPFGYKNIVHPNGAKDIQPDGLAAVIVQEIYATYVTSYKSMKQIAKSVRTKYGVKIGTAQIDRILKNPFYYGQMQMKGELYPHKYEPLIDKEQFDLAVAVARGKFVNRKIYAGLPFPYRGLIECSVCGSTITFERKKQKYVYGHCTQFKYKHKAPYISQDEITQQLKSMFASIQIPEDEYEKIMVRIRELEDKDNHKATDQLPILESEIKKYEIRLSKLYDDYSDELIDRDTYIQKKREYEETKEKLVERKSTFELSDNSWFESVSNLLKLANEAGTLFEKAEIEDKKSILNLVLSNLQLDGKLLRWKLKKPYDCMAFCSVSGNWLPGPDSNRRPID